VPVPFAEPDEPLPANVVTTPAAVIFLILLYIQKNLLDSNKLIHKNKREKLSQNDIGSTKN